MFNKFFVCTLFILVPTLLLGQTKFIPAHLENPKKYGPSVAAGFKQTLVYEYQVQEGKHALFLENGLRSAQFVNPKDWLNIRDSVYPYRVDIVYSRYPIREGEYHEIFPLLCNRLKHLFELDPAFNDAGFEWNTVLQTHCDNDNQVKDLFHGIVIWYRTPQEENLYNQDVFPSEENSELPVNKAHQQGSFADYASDIESVKNSESVSDSLRQILKDKALDEQRNLLKKYFEKEIIPGSTIKLAEISPQDLNLYQRQVQLFLKNNPFSDSVVWKVFDRHPEWRDVAVVNDWTGSMYGYGAQVVHWHITNYKSTPIRYLTLFNDGDRKLTTQKKIGETGGIYSAESADIPQIIKLFNLVRINGSGGDRPENDIEAILETQKRFPDLKEIVLIADNYACVRDIELATQISKPVKVIICGYNPDFGVNPNLVYLAKITNGGIYTLENDFENLMVGTGKNGEIKGSKENRFKVSQMDCRSIEDMVFLKVKKEEIPVYTELEKAKAESLKVRKLDLHGKSLTEIPPEIFKMEHIYYLNLSNNGLKQLPKKLRKLPVLAELDLSDNKVKKLPKKFSDIKNLESLNISNNQFQILNPFFESFFSMKFLDASNNLVSDISDLGSLRNIISLNLSNNRIKEIPLGISYLKRLKNLDLSNNQVYALPKGFVSLNKLEELNLENNQLGSLPPYLYRLKKLKSINLAGNNLSEKEKDRIRKELPLVQILF